MNENDKHSGKNGLGRIVQGLQWLRLKLSSRRRKIFQHSDPENRFTAIYQTNFWRNDESISGSGSTLHFTENLRKELPDLFAKYSVKRVLDAPCGDFNWMRMVIEETGINYIGGDIVAPLIAENQAKYVTEHNAKNIQFIHLDITKDPLPDCDLMIVRDCLFHLSYRDILAFFQQFVASDIPYLLTTSHLNMENEFKNHDIHTGHFRNIDLFTKPFNFPADTLMRIADDPKGERTREMCLFRRDQVEKAVNNLAHYKE